MDVEKYLLGLLEGIYNDNHQHAMFGDVEIGIVCFFIYFFMFTEYFEQGMFEPRIYF